MAHINQLAKSLIKLNGVSQGSVSKASGVQKGNLSIWLQGTRKLSEGAQERILSALGVVRGSLDSERVHCWTTGLDLSDLNFVLEYLCPKPELQPLATADLATNVFLDILPHLKEGGGCQLNWY